MTKEALVLADDLDDDRLRGYCQLILAVPVWDAGNSDLAWPHPNKALAAARRSALDDILFDALGLHAYSHESFGRTDKALRLLAEMLSLAQKSVSELKRYKTLLLDGNTVPDLVAQCDYYEQAFRVEIACSRNGSSTVAVCLQN